MTTTAKIKLLQKDRNILPWKEWAYGIAFTSLLYGLGLLANVIVPQRL